MIGRGREYEGRLHPPPDLMRKKVSSPPQPPCVWAPGSSIIVL